FSSFAQEVAKEGVESWIYNGEGGRLEVRVDGGLLIEPGDVVGEWKG
ncbi:hypothetical protein TrLO_g7268, partial [Triparma laevis f. longispina]